MAGIDSTIEDRYGDVPFELTTFGSSCRMLLEHHNAVFKIVRGSKDLLVTAALARCAAFSAPTNLIPATVLALHEQHFDPFFLWAPPVARAEIFIWARNLYIPQLLVNTEPFTDLPDDCACDVLEYLITKMCRAETMRTITHCSSPEAHAWVQKVVTAAVVVSTVAQNRNTSLMTYLTSSFSVPPSHQGIKYFLLCCQAKRKIALVSAAAIGDLATVQECPRERC